MRECCCKKLLRVKIITTIITINQEMAGQVLMIVVTNSMSGKTGGSNSHLRSLIMMIGENFMSDGKKSNKRMTRHIGNSIPQIGLGSHMYYQNSRGS